MHPYVKELVDEHKKLEQQLSDLGIIRDKFNELTSVLAGLRRSRPQDFGDSIENATVGRHVGATVGRSVVETPVKITIRGFAEDYLLGGPRHATEILLALRAAGWKGASDDGKDMRNLVSTLTNADRFSNIGKNTWSIKDGKQEVPK